MKPELMGVFFFLAGFVCASNLGARVETKENLRGVAMNILEEKFWF